MALGPWYVGDTPSTSLEVHIQRDGTPVEMDGYTSAEVRLFNAAGAEVTWDGTPTIDNANDVVMVTAPASSPFETAGLYTMYLTLTATAGGTETFFVDIIRVIALGVPGGWASVSRVQSITGSTVTEDVLAGAQGVIELYSGRTYAGSSVNGSIRAKDLGWLEKAVAYQAAWMPTQPGYYGKHSVKEVSQDGAQIVYAGSTQANNSALIMLAPLAMRALKNVSWMRSRSIKVKAPSFKGDHPSYGDYKRNDDHPGWMPM